MPNDDFRARLRTALREYYSHDLCRLIESELAHYRDEMTEADAWTRRIDALRQIEIAARALLTALDQAETVYPTWRDDATDESFQSRTGHRQVPQLFEWGNSLREPVQQVSSTLHRALSVYERRQKRGRGNPHTGRKALRANVLYILQDAGVPVTEDRFGPAAETLAVVLAEADRIDGRPEKERGEFRASEWKSWRKDADLLRLLTRLGPDEFTKHILGK